MTIAGLIALPRAGGSRWQAWSRRIDALTVRERVIMFVSVALVLVALLDTWVLSPRLAEHKALSQRLRAQAAEVQALRQQLGNAHTEAAQTGAGNPVLALRRELQATQRELQQVQAQIAQRTPAGASNTRLPELLAHVLRRHPRLVLQQLATGKAVAVRPGAPELQGVELAVLGSYTDLAQYVADLEASLPGLRWLELAIVRGEEGPELRAQLALPKAAP